MAGSRVADNSPGSRNVRSGRHSEMTEKNNPSNEGNESHKMPRDQGKLIRPVRARQLSWCLSWREIALMSR
jgi:hypothetical protein